MAVTPVGNPYVESSDRVSDYPGASEALAERIDIVGVNPFANAAARDAAIPSPVQGQMCSLNDDNKGYRYDGSAWILFSGAGAANFTDTATGTYSSGGISYKFLTLTSSGSTVTFDTAGVCDVLVIGSGGGGGSNQGGGGGAGGYLYVTNHLVTVGTLTGTIGAGGATATVGNYSAIGGLYVLGGGAGSSVNGSAGGSGGSGGGGSTDLAGGAGLSGQGNSGRAGGVGFSGNTGGGGGAGAAATTQDGAAGITSSITNTPVGRSGGGGGGNSQGQSNNGTASGGGGSGGFNAVGTAGTVNTGGGAGAGGNSGGAGFAGAAGGSGVIIIRVVV